MRRLALSFVFVMSGFVAGMVLTGRMRTAEESKAQTPTAGAETPACHVVGGLPDLSAWPRMRFPA